MVKVRFDPVKEIVILDKVHYSLEEFIRAIGMTSSAPITSWVEGIVFSYSVLPWSDTTIKEALNGKIYWSQVAYAELPSYKQILESKDGRIKVAVINVSSNETLRQSARWLKVLDRLGEYYDKPRPTRVAMKGAKSQAGSS